MLQMQHHCVIQTWWSMSNPFFIIVCYNDKIRYYDSSFTPGAFLEYDVITIDEGEGEGEGDQPIKQKRRVRKWSVHGLGLHTPRVSLLSGKRRTTCFVMHHGIRVFGYINTVFPMLQGTALEQEHFVFQTRHGWLRSYAEWEVTQLDESALAPHPKCMTMTLTFRSSDIHNREWFLFIM